MAKPTKEKKRTLGKYLVVLFVVAMVMGPGPGLLLVNPNVNDPQANYMFAGIPTIYAWGIFWYGVQISVLLIAYFSIWSREPES